MNRDYKVYYNNSLLHLTSDHSQMNKNFGKVLSEETDIQNFVANPKELFDPATDYNMLLITTHPEKSLQQMMENNREILAGGGIVFNEKNELLLIYRRGKWDLPKGKLDANESISEAAQREVEEETGVRIKMVIDAPVSTYHAYVLKGERCIKHTEWFIMKSQTPAEELKPQTSEDIEKAVWVKKGDLHQYKDGCYHLIWDLISVYAH